MSDTTTQHTQAAPARDALMTLNDAVSRALQAWECGSRIALTESMETLRHAQQNLIASVDFAIHIYSRWGPGWVLTDGNTPCISLDVRRCDRYDTEDQANAAAALLRASYPNKRMDVRPVAKLMEGGL